MSTYFRTSQYENQDITKPGRKLIFRQLEPGTKRQHKFATIGYIARAIIPSSITRLPSRKKLIYISEKYHYHQKQIKSSGLSYSSNHQISHWSSKTKGPNLIYSQGFSANKLDTLLKLCNNIIKTNNYSFTKRILVFPCCRK